MNAVDALIPHDAMKVLLFRTSDTSPTYRKTIQTFVAQCEEDYKLLMKLVADTTEALGRRGGIICWFRPKGQPSPQPIDPAEVIPVTNQK